jgi:uncharacterized protein (DUF1684 family)
MRLFLILFCCFIFVGCGQNPAAVEDMAAYRDSVASWHAARLEGLKGPDGWLNLAGLYWLKEGSNTFGAGTDQDLVLTAGDSAAHAGEFVLREGQVTVHVAPGVEVKTMGRAVDELLLRDDEGGDPTILTHGSLAFFAINRMGRIGIRLRDYEHPFVDAFPGIESYPVETAWRVAAELKPYPESRRVAVDTIVEGLGWDPLAPGVVEFELDGEKLSLEVFESGEDFFILFADATNGVETYPAGRFLYAERVNSDGLTVLDFNKAYNPPCAFNEFATCPLPPRRNHLEIAIPAGEKFSEALHAPAI